MSEYKKIIGNFVNNYLDTFYVLMGSKILIMNKTHKVHKWFYLLN